MNIYLSIIIPAKNEGRKIIKDIREANRFFREKKIRGEIIVSTDDIDDTTNKIVEDLQKEFKNLYLKTNNSKVGKGWGIKKGFLLTKGKFVMFADAGFCVPFDNALVGLTLLEKGYDLAIGSRRLTQSKIKVKQPLYRKIGSKAFYVVTRFIGIPNEIDDTQCGFKLYKYKVAKKLFGELKTAGWMFDIELLLRAKKHNYKIGQFPVSWSNDNDTKYKPLTGTIKNLYEILNIKLKFGL